MSEVPLYAAADGASLHFPLGRFRRALMVIATLVVSCLGTLSAVHTQRNTSRRIY